MKLTAYLLDDEANALSVLEDKITSHCPEIEIAGSSTNPLKSISRVQELQPEVIFLDIAMPGMSGFEFVEHIPNFKGEIIFVTAFDQYAVEAFKVCAIGYLLKPVNSAQLKATVRSLIERAARSQDQSNDRLNHLLELKKNNKVRLSIPTKDGYSFTNVEEIIRCESSEKYTIIHTMGNKFVSTKNIGYYVDILKNYDFFPTHKSHLVNLDFVESYDREGVVTLNNGETIPVSRRRRTEFIEQFV